MEAAGRPCPAGGKRKEGFKFAATLACLRLPAILLNPRRWRMLMNTLEPKHIILADDDSDHAFLFQHILVKINPHIKLTIAKNGTELLQLLQTICPAIVFLDLHMPYKNGIECLVEIRNTPSLQHLPIVVYSSSSKMTDIQRSYLHQADLYMVKPFNSDHLQNALESVLSIDLKGPTHIRNHYFINNRFVPFTAHNM
jgi:CheY-like chemotaxis protein